MTERFIDIKVRTGGSKGEIKSLDAEMKKLSTDTDKVTQSNKGLENSNRKMTKTAEGVQKGVASISRSFGQGSIQVQQFVGQLQGGQNVMLALSQQAADFGIVTGNALAGAFVGIGASVIGMILSANSAKKAMSELDKIAEDLNKTLSSSDGADVLSDRLEKLAKRSKALARLQISSSILDAEKQITESAKGISAALDGAFSSNAESVLRGFNAEVESMAVKLNVSVEDIIKSIGKGSNAFLSFGNVAQTSDAIRQIGDQFDISREQAVRLSMATSKVFDDSSIINIKKLENTMADLNIQSGGTSKKLNELAKELIPLFISTSDGVDKVNLLRSAFGDLSKALNTNTKTAQENKSLIESISATLRGQIIALDQGEQAYRRWNIQQQLGLKEGEKIPKAINDQITALTNLQTKQEEIKAVAAAAQFGNKLSQETEAIINEIEIRKKVNSGSISQQEGSLLASFTNRATAQENAFQLEVAKLGADEEAIKELRFEFGEKRKADALLLEQNLTSIALTESDKRIAQSEKEANQQARTNSQLLGAAVNLSTGLLKNSLESNAKTEKEQKRARKQGVIIDTAAGIARAFAENPYPVALGISALIAANGLVQLNTINSASSISTPSGGAASESTPAQSTPAQAPQQNRVIDLRTDGSAFGLAVAEGVKSALQDDDSVVVSITEAQQELVRVGGI